MRARTSTGQVYALLADGTQVEIRQLTEADREAVCALHRDLSDESLYLRFFGLNRGMADRIADQVCRPDGSGHAALGVWLRGELIGIAEYEPSDAPGEAEIAMAVADRMHHRGVGTLLLEHLGSLARENGIVAFRADTLAEKGVPSDTSMANFVLARFASEAEAAACDEYLQSQGLIVRRVTGYKLPNCLRITVGDEPSCRRVAHAIGQFKGLK